MLDELWHEGTFWRAEALLPTIQRTFSISDFLCSDFMTSAMLSSSRRHLKCLIYLDTSTQAVFDLQDQKLVFVQILGTSSSLHDPNIYTCVRYLLVNFSYFPAI